MVEVQVSGDVDGRRTYEVGVVPREEIWKGRDLVEGTLRVEREDRVHGHKRNSGLGPPVERTEPVYPSTSDTDTYPPLTRLVDKRSPGKYRVPRCKECGADF